MNYLLSVAGPASFPAHPAFPKHMVLATWGLAGGALIGLMAGALKRTREGTSIS